MKILLLIWLGKLLSKTIKFLKLGAGSTWPGHLALMVEPKIISRLASQLRCGVILVAGTNGKTTTSKMIDQILRYSDTLILRNDSGANLLNGMVSALINASSWTGKITADWAVFEVDEATLPLAISNFQVPSSNKQSFLSLRSNKKLIIVLLNLFRDQLDRYGEVDLIADKWNGSLRELTKEATVILNADDPHVAYLGQNLKAKTIFFGLNDPAIFLPRIEHAVDSIYCPKCGAKLEYEGIYFSHLGIWKCPKCGLERPKTDLSNWSNWANLKGAYNRYNTLAAVLTAKTLRIKDNDIGHGLDNFKPAFGRQEELKIDGKNIKIILSKNPAGFNEGLRVLKEFPGNKKTILLVLNDRIPDGRDVSWIWDVDFEIIPNNYTVLISGDRAYDMGLRIKYAGFPLNKTLINADLREAIKSGLGKIKDDETLYILPTYSAMLEVRKIIGGRKIL